MPSDGVICPSCDGYSTVIYRCEHCQRDLVDVNAAKLQPGEVPHGER